MARSAARPAAPRASLAGTPARPPAEFAAAAGGAPADPRAQRSLRRALVRFQRTNGVMVVGMHRSGTLAVTRVINLLGVPLGRADYIYSAGDNPSGHRESRTLCALYDMILRRFRRFRYGPAVDAPLVAAVTNHRTSQRRDASRLRRHLSRRAVAVEGPADLPDPAALAAGTRRLLRRLRAPGRRSGDALVASPGRLPAPVLLRAL